MHCGDQRHLGLCLGYVPALAYGSCRVSDQGTTLRASDLHNARATILNPFTRGTSWVAWKQRHLWSGALRTTCGSSGQSNYYYNCRWLNRNTTLLSISINLINKRVFWLIVFKNTCAYSFMWIPIYWVCRINMNHRDKISMHHDAPVNHYSPNQYLTVY